VAGGPCHVPAPPISTHPVSVAVRFPCRTCLIILPPPPLPSCHSLGLAGRSAHIYVHAMCAAHMLASCSTQHCRVRVSIECGRRAFMAFALRHSPAPRRRYQIVSSSLTTCRHLSPPVPRPLRRSPGYLRGVLPLTERALTHGEPRVAPAMPGTVACRLHVFRESLDDALIAQIRRRALMERAPVRARAMAAHVAAGTELSAEATREPPGERCVTGRRWQGWRWRSSTARLRCLVTPRRLL